MSACVICTVPYKMDVLGEVDEFAGLDFDGVVVVDDIIAGLQAAVVEVLVLVNAGVNVVREGGARDAGAGVDAGHVVPDGVYSARSKLSAATWWIPCLRSSPTMTPTPAAWQVVIMFANEVRLPRLEVRMYDTGW